MTVHSKIYRMAFNIQHPLPETIFMNAPVITLLLLCIMPLVLSWVSGYFRHVQLGAVDNKLPRLQNEQLTEMGARAVSAQKNSWEALVVYIAALSALNFSGVAVEQYQSLCWVLLVLRCLYSFFYLKDMDILRSLSFLGSYGICIYFFVLAL